MPFVRDNLSVLLVLVATVPLQYYLRTRHLPATSTSATSATWRQTLSDWQQWYTDWNDWLDEVLPPAGDGPTGGLWDDEDAYEDEDGEMDDEDRGPLVFQLQVGDKSLPLTMNTTDEWFAMSTKPRRVRPSNLKYKVGQIVFHEYLLVHCVIVGWDKIMKAPEVWVELVYTDLSDRAHHSSQPHYSVICDMREVQSVEEEVQYVSQDELSDGDESTGAVGAGTSFAGTGGAAAGKGSRRIVSTFVHEFFEQFDVDRGRYQMRPWLSKMYPRDR